MPSERSGGLAGTRTPDQCLKRALLYQLSYQPTISTASLARWDQELRRKNSSPGNSEGRKNSKPAVAVQGFSRAITG
jgi:hypothetical protein